MESEKNLESKKCQSALWNLVDSQREGAFDDPEAYLLDYMELGQCDYLYNLKPNRDL